MAFAIGTWVRGESGVMRVIGYFGHRWAWCRLLSAGLCLCLVSLVLVEPHEWMEQLRDRLATERTPAVKPDNPHGPEGEGPPARREIHATMTATNAADHYAFWYGSTGNSDGIGRSSRAVFLTGHVIIARPTTLPAHLAYLGSHSRAVREPLL